MSISVTICIEDRMTFSKKDIENLMDEINKSLNDQIIIVDEPRDLRQYENMVIVEAQGRFDEVCDNVFKRILRWLNWR